MMPYAVARTSPSINASTQSGVGPRGPSTVRSSACAAFFAWVGSRRRRGGRSSGKGWVMRLPEITMQEVHQLLRRLPLLRRRIDQGIHDMKAHVVFQDLGH